MRCNTLDRMVHFFSFWKNVRGLDYILDATFYITLIIFALMYYQKSFQGMPDDAYITYRYAYNFIAGHGLVFNVDERYYGSTAMGFALFLGSITLVVQGIQKLLDVQAPMNIPEVAVAVSAFSLMLIGACWHKILKQCSRSILAWFGSLVIGVYFIASWYSARAIGMETYAYFALLFLSSYLFVLAKRPVISGIVLALSVMIRPDAILFATILFFVSIIDYYTFNKGDKRYLKHIIMGVISFAPIIILWEICLYYYFGSWIPGTMRAKKAQVFLGHWEIFNVGNILSALNKGAFPGFLLILVFVMASVVILFTRQAITRNNASLSDVSKGLLKLCIMWVLFGTGVIVAYTSFRITAWPWYEVPIYFSLLNALISGMILLLLPFRGKITLWKWQVKALFSVAVILIAVRAASRAYKYLDYWRNVHIINPHLSSYDPIVDK